VAVLQTNQASDSASLTKVLTIKLVFFLLYSFIFFNDLLSCTIFYGFTFFFFFLNVQLLSLFCNQLKPMKISYIKIHYKFIIRCRFANENLYENMSRTLIMKSTCFAICENYLPPVANIFGAETIGNTCAQSPSHVIWSSYPKMATLPWLDL
jgi:hypothetical protein